MDAVKKNFTRHRIKGTISARITQKKIQLKQKTRFFVGRCIIMGISRSKMENVLNISIV